MITRYALFEGHLTGDAQAFRAAVRAELLPVWRALPGAGAVRVTFSDARDPGAPEFPMILAIDWPDLGTIEAFLASPARTAARAATESVLSRFFEGRIHHHITTA